MLSWWTLALHRTHEMNCITFNFHADEGGECHLSTVVVTFGTSF